MASRMKLIDGECVLDKFGPFDAITLTTYRVMEESGSDATSIMLEDLTSCRVVYSEKIFWLLLAVVALIAGVGAWLFTQGSPAPAVVGAGVAVMFFMAFRGSRKQQLTLASGA